MTGALLTRKAQSAPWLRDPLWARARQVPSFDIDANWGPLPIDRVSGLDLTTFTRAASATYVDSDGSIRTAGTNVLRRQWDATNRRWGWLVEEARTNLLLQSEDFSTAWAPSGMQAFGSGSTVNAITAPDGTITADLITENTAAGNHQVAQVISVVSDTQYTVSVYVKAGSTRNLLILVSNTNFTITPNAVFNPTTGTIDSEVNCTASIIPLLDGWYRCVLTTVAATSSGANVFALRLAQGTNGSYTGDGTSGIYLWGAQLEVGPFPTSYVRTEAAAATRDADVWTSNGVWYRQDEGAFRFEALNNNNNISGAPILLRVRNSADVAMRIDFYRSVTSAQSKTFVSDGTAQANMGSPTSSWLDNSFHTFASAYKINDFAHATTGDIVTDTSGTVPLSINQWQIGLYSGTISRLTFWPRRLDNATLQSLTR